MSQAVCVRHQLFGFFLGGGNYCGSSAGKVKVKMKMKNETSIIMTDDVPYYIHLHS